MKLRPLFLLAACALLASAPAAFAQWQNITYALRGGWNAIYLHGDATHATPDVLFASNPEVLAVWRWNPNPTPAQFTDTPLIPAMGAAEWSTWERSSPSTATLTDLPGQTAYLIRCAGTTANTYSVTIPQRPLPPRNVWVRNGANLLGFPTRQNGASFPTFSAYFATFPAAVAASARIFTYTGGELGAANPIQVFSPAATPLDRNKAYWFEAAVVGDFYAPIEISPSKPDGLAFGRAGGTISVRVRNRTAANVTLTISPVDSLPAPAGQEAVTARVPLARRTYSVASASYVNTPINSAYTEVIPAQSSVELTFSVDRAQMTAPSGALYASFLRFTDGGNLFDVYLPASARTSSFAGLWVGDASVTNVQSKVPGAAGTTTPRGYSLRVLLHVDDTGVARLLSQVFLGKLAPEPSVLGLCTRESGLKADEKANATRLVSVTMPLDTEISTGSGSVALGATLVRTVSIPFNDRANPFVHAYHPDHDNKNARGVPLSAGVESYNITRECRFEFTATPPSGAAPVGWGVNILGGNYTEILTGLHKQPITVNGTFELRRVSEIGSITLN